jgi:hypothetical protein
VEQGERPGLITEVSTMTDGRITLRAGTLYGALDRLSGRVTSVR